MNVLNFDKMSCLTFYIIFIHMFKVHLKQKSKIPSISKCTKTFFIPGKVQTVKKNPFFVGKENTKF